MVNIEATQDKLRKHIFTMATDMAIPAVYIVTENTSYSPTDGVPYITLFLMHSYTNDISIAFDDKTDNRFIYQITLHYPLNIKTDEINLETNYILERFKRGTVLTTATDVLRILTTPNFQDLGRQNERNVRAISVTVDATEL